MWLQRTFLGCVLVLAAAGAAAQTESTFRWRGGTGLGLQAGRSDYRLNVQLGPLEPTTMDRVLGRRHSQGLNVQLVGRSNLGVYGRLVRSGNEENWHPEGSGLTYGVGLSWDFSPRGSAVLGWDAYDVRSLTDVRATSLGLQWRY